MLPSYQTVVYLFCFIIILLLVFFFFLLQRHKYRNSGSRCLSHVLLYTSFCPSLYRCYFFLFFSESILLEVKSHCKLSQTRFRLGLDRLNLNCYCFNTCSFFLWLSNSFFFLLLFVLLWISFYATLVCHVAIALCNIQYMRTGNFFLFFFVFFKVCNVSYSFQSLFLWFSVIFLCDQALCTLSHKAGFPGDYLVSVKLKKLWCIVKIHFELKYILLQATCLCLSV